MLHSGGGDVDSGGGQVMEGQEEYGEPLYLTLSFAMNLKKP